MQCKSKFFLRHNLLERVLKVIMTIADNMKDEIPQYVINRETGKKSELSSSQIDKIECLTLEGVLASDQNRMIEQAKFIYSFLGKH